MSLIKITDPFPKWVPEEGHTCTDEDWEFMNKWNYIYEQALRVLERHKNSDLHVNEVLNSLFVSPGLSGVVGHKEAVKRAKELSLIKEVITEYWGKI